MTARWSHIAMATWAAPAGAVARYIPASVGAGGIEVDAHPAMTLGDGRPGAAVSVVGLAASSVRVMGVRWPRLGGFDSVALRVCVRERESGRRGVVFIREVVSSRTIAWLMRRWYNQPCVTAPMIAEVKQQTLLIGAEYRWAWPRGGLAPGSYVSGIMETEEQMVRVVGTKPAVRAGGSGGGNVTIEVLESGTRKALPNGRGISGSFTVQSRGSGSRVQTHASIVVESEAAESLESWLTERPFVFGLDQRGAGIVYEVIHPTWGWHPAVDSTVRVDFGGVFGPDLGFLTGMDAKHVMLALGSDVAMFPARGSKAGVRWGVKRE